MRRIRHSNICRLGLYGRTDNIGVRHYNKLETILPILMTTIFSRRNFSTFYTFLLRLLKINKINNK